MAAAKDCHALTDYYEKAYKKHYGQPPTDVNRYSARWGFDSVLHSMGSPQVKRLLDYYFKTPSTNKHDLGWFFYNYDKLNKGMRNAEKDAAHRAKLLEESKLRAERWRQSGQQGIAND